LQEQKVKKTLKFSFKLHRYLVQQVGVFCTSNSAELKSVVREVTGFVKLIEKENALTKATSQETATQIAALLKE